MLKIENLTKHYGDIIGVEDLSLELNQGEIFGFIGPNGAGKSTTIKCILNFLNKNNGNIYFDGELIKPSYYKFKEKIGYLPSEINLYDDLTVKEMLNYSASFYKKNIKKKIKDLVRLFEVDQNKKIDELSLGNLKKIGIIIALMHSPKLLILDEPTSGLDPLMQEKFFELLTQEKEKGTTIFFSSHNLSEVKRICDRVGIIKNGKLIALEEISNLSKNNFNIITIECPNVKKIKLPLKEITVKEMKEQELKFIYRGEINKLIKILSEHTIKKLLIEEPTIEEIFMHYYKED